VAISDATCADHPLVPVLPLLRATLISISAQARYPMVVTDADGAVLWWADDPWPARHRFTCAACAVHDPDSGDVIGAVDVGRPMSEAHPATLALVTAAAQLAEGHLRTHRLLLTRPEDR
jgi:hypothetical protein